MSSGDGSRGRDLAILRARFDALLLDEQEQGLRGWRYTKDLGRTMPAWWFSCGLCGEPAVSWDHCHAHGIVRGPLCNWCNAELMPIIDRNPPLWAYRVRGPGLKVRRRYGLVTDFTREQFTACQVWRQHCRDCAGQ